MSFLPQVFLVSADQLLRQALFKVGDEPISLLWILQILLALLLVLLITNVFKRLLKTFLLSRLTISHGNQEAIATLISYSSGVLAFLLILQVNGLNLASLAVVLGGLGVGIGFGLQDITKNLVSGLTLLLEGKLQVGDYIEFSGLSGYIKEIAMRSTIIRTFDGGDVVVPNSSLVSHQVLNWSYKNFTGKIHLPISVAYSSDPILVIETLLNSAYMEPAVLYEPPPRAIFKGFGENALEFDLWVWVSRIDEGISVRSSLNFIIDHNFRQAGIQMPFPQRDLWLRNPEVLQTQPDRSNGLASPATAGPSNPTSIRLLLKQVPYLEHCSDLHIRKIIETGYRKILTESEALFHEGEIGNAVYFVLSGAIAAISTRLDKCIKVYRPGEFFGESSTLLGIPYSTTAQALEETSLFVIHKANFEKLISNHPQLAEVLAQELSREKETYAEIRQQLQDMGLLDMTDQHQSFVSWIQTRLKSFFNH